MVSRLQLLWLPTAILGCGTEKEGKDVKYDLAEKAADCALEEARPPNSCKAPASKASQASHKAGLFEAGLPSNQPAQGPAQDAALDRSGRLCLSAPASAAAERPPRQLVPHLQNTPPCASVYGSQWPSQPGSQQAQPHLGLPTLAQRVGRKRKQPQSPAQAPPQQRPAEQPLGCSKDSEASAHTPQGQLLPSSSHSSLSNPASSSVACASSPRKRSPRVSIDGAAPAQMEVAGPGHCVARFEGMLGCSPPPHEVEMTPVHRASSKSPCSERSTDGSSVQEATDDTASRVVQGEPESAFDSSNTQMVCYNATCARQIDVLHCQLEASERSRLMAEAALQRRTQECESLMRVVKELATSRATLVNLRTTQAERLAELQHEYLRVLRIADLARQVSKENIGKAAKAQKKLERAEDAIRLQRQTISDLKSHNAELRQDNLDLRQMCLLERIDLYWFGREFLRFAPTWDSGPGCAAAPAMADTELLGQAREPVWVM